MADELSLPGMRALQQRDLQQHRGGFSVAGLQINFGFSIETTVNNQFTVVSNFNVNTPGEVTGLGTTVAQLTAPDEGSAEGLGGDAALSAADLIADVNKAIGASSGETATQAILASVAEDVDQTLSSSSAGDGGKSETPQETVVPVPAPAVAEATPQPAAVAAEPPIPDAAPVPVVEVAVGAFGKHLQRSSTHPLTALSRQPWSRRSRPHPWRNRNPRRRARMRCHRHRKIRLYKLHPYRQ